MLWLNELALKLADKRYNYRKHLDFSDSYSKKRKFTDAQKNAFAHAYLSAMITYENSETEAKLLGDERERRTTDAFYSGRDKDFITDTYRDLYNNAVGRAIGRHAKTNGLHHDNIAAIIEDAVQNDELIISIDRKASDRKLPAPDNAGRPGGFSGWPKDFPHTRDVWRLPTFNERFNAVYPPATFSERFEALKTHNTSTDTILNPRPDRYRPEDEQHQGRINFTSDILARETASGVPQHAIVQQTDLHDDVQRRGEIEAEMRKPRADNLYWRTSEMQQEYRDLIQRMDSRPTSLLQPREGDAARKAEIEAEMRKGRDGAYWRKDSFMPEEYRAILEREAGGR